MITPRPELERAAFVPHGGFHQSGEKLLDFSSNVNPFGPSPRVWDAMREVTIGQHPDPRAAPLREFLAAHEGVGAENLLVGNGSVELIYALGVAYVRAGDTVLVVTPTFGEYAASARIMGAVVQEFRLCEEDNFALNAAKLVERAKELKPRLLFLCNPNNPTGTYTATETMFAIAAALPETLVVWDEAFVRLMDGWEPGAKLSNRPRISNLVVLRSLTKDYALTGLRVGYALGAPDVIEALEKVQPPWSVNSFAQAAAMAAVEDGEFFLDSLRQLSEAKRELVAELEDAGFAPLVSPLNFFLLPVSSAKEWTARLRTENIRVRDCTSHGLPMMLRIAARRADENVVLVKELKRLMGRKTA